MRVVALFDPSPAEVAVLSAVPGMDLQAPRPARGVLREAEVAVVHSFADLPGDVWEEAPRLRWIVSLAAGADHVPFARLPPGVRVVSVHGPNADALAEHAFALLLAAAKHLVPMREALRGGAFPQERLSRRLNGSTLLVVGAGAVGSKVLRLGRAFGMRTLAARRSGAPHPDADETLGPHELAGAWGQAAFVVLALPLTRATRGLVGEDALARMRADAVLVNVGRGKLVDREALARRLDACPDFTYASDVWWRYPREGRFEEPLLARPNVLGTPHAGVLVPGWRLEMAKGAAEALRAIVAGGADRLRVEDPAEHGRAGPPGPGGLREWERQG